MGLKDQYVRAKANLLNEEAICYQNRALFSRFFEFEEYKLKRRNGLSSLDAGCYKTLLAYTSRLRTVNRWFRNKPWEDLTEADIKQVYDALEDGQIQNRFGRPIKDRASYYNQVIRSKPFEMAGKLPIVNAVMEFAPHRTKEEVRFIKEQTFRQLVEATSRTEHRCFLWLAWDIGENVNSILQLRKRDCQRQQNDHSKEPEYLVNLRREILKRSRRPRSELTNYAETVRLLDSLLNDKNDDDRLFDYGVGWAKQLAKRLARKTNTRCLPAGQELSIKDLRSSMACDLLAKGWSRDEVNARLGHTPSSREIDKYINYFALDRTKSKKRFSIINSQKLLSRWKHSKIERQLCNEHLRE